MAATTTATVVQDQREILEILMVELMIQGLLLMNSRRDEEAIKAAKEEEKRNRTRCFNLPKIKAAAAKKNIHNNNRRSQGIEVLLKDILDAATEYFELTTIRISTNNFSVQNKIGQGGFGEVYKGVLNNGKTIAVKRLAKYSGQGTEEFLSELKSLPSVKHPNIVRLLGYCTEREECILLPPFTII